MGNPWEGIGGLLIAVTTSVVLGIAFLLLVYKLIDGDLPLIPGIVGLGVILVLVLLSVKPIHPAVPMVVLIVTLTVMGLFPYASTQLEEAELRAIDTARLEKAYEAIVARPDNVPVLFEIARRLNDHGMKGHAVGIATQTLDALSRQVDEVSNRSLRDTFRVEEYEVKRWRREIAKEPALGRQIPCPHCGHRNGLELIVCANCGEAYVLTLARSLDVRKRFFGKLVLAAAAIAGLIVGASAIGLYLGGIAAVAAFVGAIAGVGLFINMLFGRPKLAR